MSGNNRNDPMPRYEPRTITVKDFYLGDYKSLLTLDVCEAFTDSTWLCNVRNVFKAGADTDGFIVSCICWDGNDEGDEILVRPDFTLYLKWKPANQSAIVAQLIQPRKDSNVTVNESVWVAFAETDAIRDVALFHSPEGAKKWCDEMIKKYHGLDILPEWHTGESGGSIRWQPACSFTYYLQEVQP